MSSKPRGYTLSDTFFLSSFFSFQEARNSKILFQIIKQKAVLQEQVLIAGCEKLLQKVESSSTFCNKNLYKLRLLPIQGNLFCSKGRNSG